ncbi:hypothetical protein [uncultured Ruminococcus sp.]|uniref:hypothetical protein n=1 Tax=uncultured Ruminococcus sp. TaxID=165186 RepID=UPI0025E9D42D|nr:hypothetical protein [uncultured Ruminococcus sp.]
MEKFRKKIKKRFWISTFVSLFVPLVLIALQIITKKDVDYASGMLYGAVSGALVTAVFNIARMYSALHNEEKLKKMYIEETDERNIMLNKETGNTALIISLVCISFASVIASFFNIGISIALAAAACFTTMVTVIVRIYYNKTM